MQRIQKIYLIVINGLVIVIGPSGVRFIMEIELSGVQFGLKSYSSFQNRASAQREFDLKSQV